MADTEPNAPEPTEDPVPPRTVDDPDQGLAPSPTTAPEPTVVTEWPDYVEEQGGDVGTTPEDAPKVEDWAERAERTGQDAPTQDSNVTEGWDAYVERKAGAENAQADQADQTQADATTDPEPPAEPKRSRKA